MIGRNSAKQMAACLAFAGLVNAFAPVTSKAEPAAGVTVTCPATGPAIAGCVAGAVVVHEVVQCANGKDCFSKKSEGGRIERKVRHWWKKRGLHL